MNKVICRTLVGVVAVAMVVAVSGCTHSSDGKQVASRVGKQKEHEGTKADLVLQFHDDFGKDYGPPDHFDITRWTRFRSGQTRTENGYGLMELVRPPPPGPGSASFGGMATTEKFFAPGLAGTNGVEITVAGFSHEDYPQELNKPGQLLQAWGLTIASWHGQIGGQPEKDRGVQVHFDLLRDDGLYVYLVRGLLPEDFGKYPQDGFGRKESKDLTDKEKRALHEEAIERGGSYITVPCLALATRVYRSEQEIQDMLGRSRRYGLYLTDDANTVYWTLDDQVMDSVDITGYFSSSPESVQGGAFVTIAGVAIFQRNSWKMDDLEIRAAP